MSETTNLVEQVQLEVREIAGPLVNRYEQIKSDIDRREIELDGLRKARTQLAKVIRGIDPTLIEPSTYGAKKNGKKQAATGLGLSPERAETLHKFLLANATEVNEMNEGRGFHSSGLFRTYGREGIGLPDSSVAIGLRILHEQGLIRLVGMGNGGAKFYKVIVPST